MESMFLTYITDQSSGSVRTDAEWPPIADYICHSPTLHAESQSLIDSVVLTLL